MLQIPISFPSAIVVGGGDDSAVPSPPMVRKVIIADRFPIVRQGLRAVIETSPVGSVTVVGETDNHSDLEMLVQTTAPDIIFLDTYLHNHSTLGFVKSLRSVEEGIDGIKLFVVSDQRDKNHIISFISAGVDGYILKGCPHLSLATYVDYAMRIGFVISPDVQRLAIMWMRDSPPMLTDTEKRVLQLGAKGESNGKIATTLGMSAGTVNNHFTNIYRKVPWINSRAEIIAWAWINWDGFFRGSQ